MLVPLWFHGGMLSLQTLLFYRTIHAYKYIYTKNTTMCHCWYTLFTKQAHSMPPTCERTSFDLMYFNNRCSQLWGWVLPWWWRTVFFCMTPFSSNQIKLILISTTLLTPRLPLPSLQHSCRFIHRIRRVSGKKRDNLTEPLRRRWLAGPSGCLPLFRQNKYFGGQRTISRHESNPFR